MADQPVSPLSGRAPSFNALLFSFLFFSMNIKLLLMPSGDWGSAAVSDGTPHRGHFVSYLSAGEPTPLQLQL